MIPSLNLSFQSGVSGPVTSGASSGNGSGPAGTANFSAGGVDANLLKYAGLAAVALVLVLVVVKSLRK